MENVFLTIGNVKFDSKRYFTLLNTNVLGRKLIFFDSISSTNDIAKDYAELGEWGLCILAEEQTKGRGTHGRRWSTCKGQSIALSIILPPEWIKNTAFLSISAAKAVVKALEKFDVHAYIKYPNDVYLNGRKLAGILTETFFNGECLKYAIIGIGVNLNQDEFHEELKDIAISVKQVLGCSISREEFLAFLLNEVPATAHFTFCQS
ncbi:Bifunctional ligase/repressor BirA [Caloramator mitchellensis]|uniref:Bifunctional ligase/repressor BirA n=1 Tax=Caloramator mitchellensis TaxID=908809 RepID=A0A0R3JWG9_CALMK|nr:biotin--[acetyl-CoA-carboxylase] ligase [Caloramator mitchellensis]KRQ87875.1 Bifunctional ligase/repressor BirA [Caloramator mitchellensis]